MSLSIMKLEILKFNKKFILKLTAADMKRFYAAIVKLNWKKENLYISSNLMKWDWNSISDNTTALLTIN